MPKKLNNPNIQRELSPELFFLISCCQTEPDFKDIASQLKELPDTKKIIVLASRHGILPLVYKTLRHSKLDLNTNLLTELKSRYMHISQKNMLMTAELIKTMKLFKENNIEALAFKGPTLAQLAYGDITLRQYGDLDILIDKTQLVFANKILQKNGYTLLYPQKVLTSKTCLGILIDVGYLHNNVHIELHWKLLQSKHAGKNALAKPGDFKKEVTINTYTLNALANELLLVYLCLHGSKHAWERIEWICDIDRLIRSQDFDWIKAVQIADASQLKRAFYLGLTLTHSFFNTPLPEYILKEIHISDTDILKEATIVQLNTASDITNDFIQNKKIFFYQLGLFGSVWDRILFIIHSFLHISPADCMTYTLPEALKFLYIVLRPVRLASSYTKRFFSNTK